MPDTAADYSVNFLLGRVRSDAQLARLSELACWLDQNKFSCTLSIVEGFAMFDICPHDPTEVTPETYDTYRLYVAEILIHALCKELANNDN